MEIAVDAIGGYCEIGICSGAFHFIFIPLAVAVNHLFSFKVMTMANGHILQLIAFCCGQGHERKGLPEGHLLGNTGVRFAYDVTVNAFHIDVHHVGMNIHEEVDNKASVGRGLLRTFGFYAILVDNKACAIDSFCNSLGQRE